MRKIVLNVVIVAFGMSLPQMTNAQLGAKIKDKLNGGGGSSKSSGESGSDKPAKESREA